MVFSAFLPLKLCWNTYLYSVFNINQNLAKRDPQKNDNFSHFAKKGFINKKPFCCNPTFFKYWCFFLFNLSFLKATHWCWTKNTNQNQDKAKNKKNGFERKTSQETKQRERIMKKLWNLIVSCCSFHETKAKKKEKYRRGRKNKNKRETENEEVKKGEAQKRLRRNKGRHSKISKNALFRGGNRKQN